MTRPAVTPAPQQAAEPGVIGGFCLGVVKVLGWLILGLVFSLLAEWLGMTFWWPEEGTHHSRRMLEAELGYLAASVPQSLVSTDPAGFARRLADGFYHYGFEVTGIASGVERLNAPAQTQDPTLLKISRALYAPAASYLLAAITIRRSTRYGGGWLALTRPGTFTRQDTPNFLGAIMPEFSSPQTASEAPLFAGPSGMIG